MFKLALLGNPPDWGYEPLTWTDKYQLTALARNEKPGHQDRVREALSALLCLTTPSHEAHGAQACEHQRIGFGFRHGRDQRHVVE